MNVKIAIGLFLVLFVLLSGCTTGSTILVTKDQNITNDYNGATFNDYNTNIFAAGVYSVLAGTNVTVSCDGSDNNGNCTVNSTGGGGSGTTYYAGSNITISDNNYISVNDGNLALTFYKQTDANIVFVKVSDLNADTNTFGNAQWIRISDSNNTGRLNYQVIANPPWLTSVSIDLNGYVTQATFDTNFFYLLNLQDLNNSLSYLKSFAEADPYFYSRFTAVIDGNVTGIINNLDLNNSLAYLKATDLNAYISWTDGNATYVKLLDLNGLGDQRWQLIGNYLTYYVNCDNNANCTITGSVGGALDINTTINNYGSTIFQAIGSYAFAGDLNYGLDQKLNISDSNNAGWLDYGVIANPPWGTGGGSTDLNGYMDKPKFDQNFYSDLAAWVGAGIADANILSAVTWNAKPTMGDLNYGLNQKAFTTDLNYGLNNRAFTTDMNYGLNNRAFTTDMNYGDNQKMSSTTFIPTKVTIDQNIYADISKAVLDANIFSRINNASLDQNWDRRMATWITGGIKDGNISSAIPTTATIDANVFAMITTAVLDSNFNRGTGIQHYWNADQNFANVDINFLRADLGIGIGGSALSGMLYNGNTGTTQILLNSNGSNYGRIQNDIPNLWSLAYGTGGTSALGTPALKWDINGIIYLNHLEELTASHLINFRSSIDFNADLADRSIQWNDAAGTTDYKRADIKYHEEGATSTFQFQDLNDNGTFISNVFTIGKKTGNLTFGSPAGTTGYNYIYDSKNTDNSMYFNYTPPSPIQLDSWGVIVGTEAGLNITSVNETTPNTTNYGTFTTNGMLTVVDAAKISNNTAIDPDSYTNATVSGLVEDGSGFSAVGIGGKASGTGDTWAIVRTTAQLVLATGNGTAGNTLLNGITIDNAQNTTLYGYLAMPNCGEADTNSGGATTVTYPEAMPDANVAILVTAIRNSQTNILASCYTYARTTTTFNVACYSGGLAATALATRVSWCAVDDA